MEKKSLESYTEEERQALQSIQRSVTQLYSDTLLTDDELSKEGPKVDFVISEGVILIGFSLFSAERLNKNRESISQIFDLLLKTDQPVDVLEIGRALSGDCRANIEADRLLQLGLAAGIVEFSEFRSEQKDGNPSIVRCKGNDKAKQFVKRPGEYAQVLQEMRQRLS